MINPTPPEPTPTRFDRFVPLALGIAALLLYRCTLCPTVFWYDSAEYAAAAFFLGIPHPPGYPVYTVLGKLFTFLPMEPARALNWMSAVFAATSVGLVYRVTRRLGGSVLAGVMASLTLATTSLFWSQSIIAEVYTPGLCVLLVVILLLLRGYRERAPLMLVLAAGLAGVGLGVHLSIATCGLGFVWLVLATPLPWRKRLMVAGACALSAAIGSLVFLYVPLRARAQPEINFQDPSTWERFWWFVTGGNYKGWFLHGYDFVKRALMVGGIFYDQLLVVGLLLTGVGLVALARANRNLAVSLFLMGAGNIYFFFNYRVHDVEVFFLPTLALACIMVGLGAHALLAELAAHASSGRRTILTRVASAAILSFPLIMGVVNYSHEDLSHYFAARDYGERLCQDLPRGAVILNYTTPPEWKNDAVFSLYFQKVLRRRPDVTIVLGPSPQEVVDIARTGRSLFLYYPVSRVTALFNVVKEGVVYRVAGVRRRS